ncbi:MAG: DUF1587 domain-containing protein, partial [Planctomycetaceae bacterium]
MPLITRTCGACHGEVPKDNELVLTRYATADAFLAEPAVLEHIVERVRTGDMPPRESPQPTEAEREQMVSWFLSALDAEAAERAGDPGPVTLRRLTNTEYDNAVRDLTGIDFRPTQAREFPPDAVGGEGFANVGEAMPVTPVLVERYLQAARDVAARAVLLPTGFRFSASPDRPEWAAEAEKALRAFHARSAGGAGEPPLEKHLTATLRHRERLARGDADAIAAVAAKEQLSVPYLTALWRALGGTSVYPAEDLSRAKQWYENVVRTEAERQRRQATLDAGKRQIAAGWAAAKRVLGESKVPEGGSVPFEHAVTVRRGEVLLLTVSPNKSHGADSTLVEWTIRETTGDGRTWRITDLVADLHKGNPWLDAHEARWSFLEGKSPPVFLTEKRDANAGRSEVKSWSLGSEPSVFVNSAAEPLSLWTKLPARSVFVHPGNNRPVAIAWTSPIDGDLVITGRVADVHPGDTEGVAFELSHVASPEQGQALADLGTDLNLPGAGPPPATLALVRETWREATTDPKPVMQVIKVLQEKLFWNAYNKFKVLAVGNGFPMWERMLRVVARDRLETAARDPSFRLVALEVAPKQPGTFVVWDRLRLEGAGRPTIVLAEHPDIRAALEAAGHRFGHHPLGRPVPPTALVMEASTEVTLDLTKLAAPLLESLALPRFLRADVSLDEGSPEAATVQPLLLGQADNSAKRDNDRCFPHSWRSGKAL